MGSKTVGGALTRNPEEHHRSPFKKDISHQITGGLDLLY